jgi:hypothetical protein
MVDLNSVLYSIKLHSWRENGTYGIELDGSKRYPRFLLYKLNNRLKFEVYAELPITFRSLLTLKYMINSRYQSGNTDVMVQDIKKFNKLTNDFVTLGYIKVIKGRLKYDVILRIEYIKDWVTIDIPLVKRPIFRIEDEMLQVLHNKVSISKYQDILDRFIVEFPKKFKDKKLEMLI